MGQQPPVSLTTTELAILEVLLLARRPLSSTSIAEKGGLNPNSIPTLIKGMQKKGVVRIADKELHRSSVCFLYDVTELGHAEHIRRFKEHYQVLRSKKSVPSIIATLINVEDKLTSDTINELRSILDELEDEPEAGGE